MQPALLPSTFGDRHLLGIEGLSAGAITHLLDLSEGYVALNREVQKAQEPARRAHGGAALLRDLDPHPHLRSNSRASASAPT